MDRKLLSAAKVAAKLDQSQSSFERKRAQLEQDGFPPPVLKKDLYGSEKWDEAAIDLWLDNQMPDHLKNMARQPMPVDITHTLQQRAEALQL